MNIISNDKLIARNAKIGQYSSLVSLVILGIGMYISFTRQDLFNISIIALLVGFILSQVGIYYGNRWGRSPRPDELLQQGLKGMSKEYTLYQYISTVPHLLVGPAGVWILLPHHQQGTIIYDGKKWKAKEGGFAQSYMRIFGQENMSRPDLEAGAQADKLKRNLRKEMDENEIPPILGAIVFTSKNATVEADDAPIATLHAKQLKPYLRKFAKEAPLTKTEIAKINEILQA
jgi:hypothetical protein